MFLLGHKFKSEFVKVSFTVCDVTPLNMEYNKRIQITLTYYE